LKNILKPYLKFIIIVLIGFLLGSGIALYRITHWKGKDATIKNGSWNGQKLDNVGKNPLLTARIAVAALFALRPDETIYLVAKDDTEGQLLSGNHDYIVTGVPMAARYWSITMYGEDYFLVPNEVNRFNYNMMSLQYESDSSFSFHISPTKKEGNWLPSGENHNFYLTLRLYHPDEELVNTIETANLPIIKRVEK
jgi:hypothetical protein